MAKAKTKKAGSPKGPRNWVNTQKRFLERTTTKLGKLALRLPAGLDVTGTAATKAVSTLLSKIDTLPADYRPNPNKSTIKPGDEVFMQPSLREKYKGLVTPKSVTEAMLVEQIDGRRVRLKLAGGETLILPVNLLARTKPEG